MSRLLVTGASGLLGANLVLEAMGSHQVTAVSRRRPLRMAGVTSHQVDLADEFAALELIASAAPDWVIHCAAATEIDECERAPEMARRVNREMAAATAAAASARGAAFVQVSTDAVFDGRQGNYAEADEPNPINVYGRSKLEGEHAVLEAHPQALIVRTNIYGWNAQAKRSLAEWFLHRCESGLRSPGWTDVWSTPTLVNDLAGVLLRLLQAGMSGLFHVGGATCLSKHDFGRRVAEAFGHDPSLVEAASISQSTLLAPRGRQVCLRSDKVEAALGIRLPTVEEGLERFRRMRGDGTLARLKSALAEEAPARPGRVERHR